MRSASDNSNDNSLSDVILNGGSCLAQKLLGEVRKAEFNSGEQTRQTVKSILDPLSPESSLNQLLKQSSKMLDKGRTRTQTFAWGAMQTLVMAVTSRTLSEFICKENSLEAALVVALIAPLSVEYLKKMFNLSGAVKKELSFNLKSNLGQVAVLMALAPTFYYTGFNKDFSAIGYDASILVPAICLKLLVNYLEARFSGQETADTAVYSPLLVEDMPQIADLEAGERPDESVAIATDVPTATWGNWCAMHVAARLPLLFCATNAGGQFFEAMNIPLAEGIEAAGLKNFAGAVAVSVVLNEIIGSHFFKASGVFKEVHPNLIPRLVTLFGLAVILQAANVMKDVNMVNFVLAFAIGFITDLVVDTAVEKSGLGAQIDKGIARFLAKGYECATASVTSAKAVCSNGKMSRMG